MPESLFRIEGERFVPTRFAESPWSSAGLHGGPAAGLLARAIERTAAADDLVVARLTVDLFRQVPNAPLEVTTRVVRQGRRIQASEASLWSDGVEVSRASGLLLQQTEVDLPESALPADLVPPFPEVEIDVALSGGVPGAQPGFHHAVHCRRLNATDSGWPMGIAWFRLPGPLVEGETNSPFVVVASIADFTNALAGPRNAGVGFINCDISLNLIRPTESDWICLQVDAHAQPTGIAMAHARVFDRRGLIGMVSESRLANRRAPGMAPMSSTE